MGRTAYTEDETGVTLQGQQLHYLELATPNFHQFSSPSRRAALVLHGFSVAADWFR